MHLHIHTHTFRKQVIGCIVRHSTTFQYTAIAGSLSNTYVRIYEPTSIYLSILKPRLLTRLAITAERTIK
jgi:hypothetical protein